MIDENLDKLMECIVGCGSHHNGVESADIEWSDISIRSDVFPVWLLIAGIIELTGFTGGNVFFDVGNHVGPPIVWCYHL